jgi:hypothetical protein
VELVLELRGVLRKSGQSCSRFSTVVEIRTWPSENGVSANAGSTKNGE